LDSIKKAGFKNVQVLEEKAYIEEQENSGKDTARKITSILVKAVKE
jgi:arsenite methyltransferase